MSYVKKFGDFEITAHVQPGRVWLLIGTTKNSSHAYDSESGFAYAPNFIERLFGVTWQDKLERKEKELFRKLLKRIQYEKRAELENEVSKFLES
jgi:hypothetical protein